MKRRTVDASEIAPIEPGRYWRTNKRKEKVNLPSLAFRQHDIPFEVGDRVSIHVPSCTRPFEVIIVRTEPEVIGILQGLDDDEKREKQAGIPETKVPG
jgi:hypothetical protein